MYPQKEALFGKDWVLDIEDRGCGNVSARTYLVRTHCCGAEIKYSHKSLLERMRNNADYCGACYRPGMYTRHYRSTRQLIGPPRDDVKGWGRFLQWHKEKGVDKPPR